MVFISKFAAINIMVAGDKAKRTVLDIWFTTMARALRVNSTTTLRAEKVRKGAFYKRKLTTLYLGTMYLVIGDVINGEWREEQIIRATYKKGKFDTIPK